MQINWYKKAQGYFDIGKGYWIADNGELINVEDWAGAHADSFLQYLEKTRPPQYKEVKDQLEFNTGHNIDSMNECDVSHYAEAHGWIHINTYRNKFGKEVLEVGADNPSDKAINALLSFIQHRDFDHMLVNGVSQFSVVNLMNAVRTANLRDCWYKKAFMRKLAIRGEWWIIDGQPNFADGDVGDMNHEAYVVGHVQAQYADERFNRGDYVDWAAFEQTFQDPNRALKALGMSDEEIQIARGEHPDAREYGIKKLGWKRIHGNNIETQFMTERDMKEIADSIWEIDEQVEVSDETFNIEIGGNGWFLRDVPWSVLASENPANLLSYK